MSEAVSALRGVRFDGIARVEERGPCGMITLRGDLASGVLKKAVKAATGKAVPEPNRIGAKGAVCWMSPDELLILCPYEDAENRVARLGDHLGDAHALAVNVSDTRALFRVSGPATREVMAKLTPADLSPEAFAPGVFRRSRLAQVPAAFWMEEDGAVAIICFRSVAEYVFNLLRTAAQPGSAVGYF